MKIDKLNNGLEKGDKCIEMPPWCPCEILDIDTDFQGGNVLLKSLQTGTTFNRNGGTLITPKEAKEIIAYNILQAKRADDPDNALDHTISFDYLNQLQKQVGAWAYYNFDDKDKLSPFMGMIEELGELAKFERVNKFFEVVAKMHHHVLKDRQGIRGKDHELEYGILLDFLENMLEEGVLNWENREKQYFEKHTGDILHKKTGAVMTEAEIHAERQDAVGDLTVFQSDYCARNRFSFGNIVHTVWSRVKNRDWRSNPTNAAEIEEQANAQR